MKPYGNVVRIRRIYDDDIPANRCYVAFTTAKETATALQAVGKFGMPDVRAEVLSSANVVESDNDYIPNIFQRAAEAPSSNNGQAPTPR